MSQSSPRPVSQQSNHPALAALRNAPIDDEPTTPEENAACERAREDCRAGRTISLQALADELGVTLDP